MILRRFYFLNLCIFLCSILCSIFFTSPTARAGNDKPVQSDLNGLTRSPLSMKYAAVIDGTKLLGQDQKIYKFPVLSIPENFPDIEEKAQKRVQELVLGQKCTLYLTRKSDFGRMNYLGESLVELVCGPQNIWISGQLVSEGLALVAPNISNPETVTELLKIEAQARAAKIGLWRDAPPSWQILTADQAAQHLNSWQIVSGQIQNVGMTKDMVFLNFGKNWKDDFTVSIPNELRREMMKNRINPQSLRGQTVRIRGWVRNYNGAMIDLETLGQLEILPPTLAPTLGNDTQEMAKPGQNSANSTQTDPSDNMGDNPQENTMHTIKNGHMQDPAR